MPEFDGSSARNYMVNLDGSNDMNSMSDGEIFTSWMGDLFGPGLIDRVKESKNKVYEQQNLASARAWDEYMDSTAVQRRMKDLEAAGVNPWLAVQNMSAGSSPSSSASASTGTSGKGQKDNSKGIVTILAAVLKALLA